MRIDKDNIKIILILLVVCLGIGYSYLNTELNINGTANINSANWSVYWNNVQVKAGSVTAPTPTIDSDKTTVSYTVTLAQPGDYYEFTVDAVNGGTIDAMIDSIDSKLNGATITTLPDYLSYTVTYEDGVELEPNHLLAANSTETYKINIKYRDDIELNQIPASNQSLSLQFTVTYRQANENAEEVEHAVTKYTVNRYDSSLPNNNSVLIGQAMPNGITQYNSASDAMAAFENRPFYLKHTVQGGVVTESYVEFIVTSAMASSNQGMTAGTYALRGLDTYDENASSTNYCKAEYYNSSTGECLSAYYASNKATLLSAFGSSNCTDFSSYFDCSVSGLIARAHTRDYVGAGDGDWHCGVDFDGSSDCGSNLS